MQSIQLKNLHQTQISFELNIIHTPLKFLLDGAYFSCFQLSALHFPIDAIKWARTKLITVCYCLFTYVGEASTRDNHQVL